MTDVYEFSEFDRNDLVYDYVTLTHEEREQKKLNYQKFEAEKAAEKAAKKLVVPAATAEVKVEVKPKVERAKCPNCGAEYRISWPKPDLPYIRGNV